MSRTRKKWPKPWVRFWSRGCRPHGSCPWCRQNRRHKVLRQAGLKRVRRVRLSDVEAGNG